MKKNIVIKYVRIGPKKMRIFAKLFVGMPVTEAKPLFLHTKNRGASILLKALNSCINLFEEKNEDNMTIKEIAVDKGPSFKRWRAGGRGVAKKYIKHTAHIRVCIEQK